MAIHQKVTASLVAGAIVGLIVAEAKRRGVPIEADEASDLTVLISTLAAYYMPSTEGLNGSNGSNGSNGDQPEPSPAPQPAPPRPAPAPQPPTSGAPAS